MRLLNLGDPLWSYIIHMLEITPKLFLTKKEPKKKQVLFTKTMIINYKPNISFQQHNETGISKYSKLYHQWKAKMITVSCNSYKPIKSIQYHKQESKKITNRAKMMQNSLIIETEKMGRIQFLDLNHLCCSTKNDRKNEQAAPCDQPRLRFSQQRSTHLIIILYWN